MTLAQQLAQGVLQLGFALPEGAQQRLLEYLALLQKWNRLYNLTAVREAPRMVSQHLLDCLAAAPHVGAATLLDVGSGAGLPGIPLALALPDSRVTLLESSHKKAAFLRQAVMELKLRNAEVVCERVEAWKPPVGFAVVISRALSDLAEFVSLAGRHAAAGGRLEAMKGVHPYEEIAQLPPGWQVRQVIPLTVPGLRAQRHLVTLVRSC
ncbi:MAG TPA: 16S rRNA (guanine(527)-N(7))-methyltransferase RsmG [Burkholderiales bacterium]|nr:16S rRNA (guanine(527)-N(7))-methyltransferase RsmG [Burkholderiales bacterium]